MFQPDGFKVPLEKELNMRVMYDEIEGCTDVAVLQEHLKALVEQNSKLQHLLNTILEAQLQKEMEKLKY